MSLDVVAKKIEVVERKLGIRAPVKAEDIEPVLVAAEKSEKGRSDGVSNAEGRAVADLYIRLKAGKPVAKTATPAQAPAVDDAVFKGIDRFFMAHNLPYGENKAPMKERLNAALVARGNDLGEQLSRPPRTGSLQPLRLSAVGEPQKDAYVDVVKKQFVVKLAGQFYGPFGFDS